jgi:hypothetical protein
VNGHVWPASHDAGSIPGAPPLGTRLRLKASTDLAGIQPPELRKVFEAMKTYGVIVADQGGANAPAEYFHVTGTQDARWSNPMLYAAFIQLHASDFEVVELGWGQP